MGVASLKIEGRMKRPEYVAAAVSAIRTACEGRRWTLKPCAASFPGAASPRATLTDASTGRCSVTARRRMSPRRRACWANWHGSMTGKTAGAGVHASGGPCGTATRLTVSDRDGHTFTVEGSVPQTAINKPTTPERAAQNLGKTGGTPFYADEMDCDLDDGLMIPASELNALRREALEQLIAVRSDVQSHAFTDRAQRAFPRTRDRKIPTLRARLRLSQLTPEIAAGARI